MEAVRISSTPDTFSFLMLIDRHTAAIITDFDQSILVQSQGQLAGKACQCLIDTVVDDLLNEVIRTGCIGIHTRALANGSRPVSTSIASAL